MATQNIGDRFRRWRRVRPFWGGLLLVLSGLEMLGSANMELDNITIHIGPQGFYSYLLPVMLITAGVLTWFSPAQRLFYGVIAILTALYSFIGLNLGGWIAGMMLGIVGGALVIAWGPPRNPPVKDSVAPPGEPTGQVAGEPGDEPAGGRPAPGAGIRDERPAQEIGPAGERPATGSVPRPRSVHRNALIIMAPLLVAATVTVAGHRPAEAAECPEGLPSRKASVAPRPSTGKPSPSATRTSPDPAPATISASPSPSPTGQESEHPILDGITDFWEGVGDLIGIGGNKQAEATPAPAASPSVTPSAPAPATTPAKPGTSPPASAPASAKPEEIPCLGARQMNVRAGDGGLPLAGAKPGIVKVASLTMYESTYDGVAEVPTGNGPVRSLKFSMDKVVNKPFSLTIDEPGNATTVIESGELTLDGNVEFYSPTFKGKLFGLIPVTFTPEQPPPLTLPVLWFTDVTLDLAYVRSDILTAKPLAIVEKRG